jgi:hypothetical protein
MLTTSSKRSQNWLVVFRQHNNSSTRQAYSHTSRREALVKIMTSLSKQLTIIENDDCITPEKWTPLQGKNNNDSFGTITTADKTDSRDDDFASPATFVSSQTVRFSVMVKIHLISSMFLSSTEKEISRCWYSNKDLKKMNAKRERVVARMEEGKPETKGHPYRGLEASTEEGNARVTGQINQMVNAVLDEQDSQRMSNIRMNEERIAFISKRISAVSVREAQRAAHLDEQDATATHFTLPDVMRSYLSDDDCWASVATKETAPSASGVQGQKNNNKFSKVKKHDSRRTRRRKTRSERRQDPPGTKTVENFTNPKQRKRVRFLL